MELDEHIRETYAHFGRAMYMAQALEHGLVNGMLVSHLASGARLSPEDVDSFMDQRFELTLGRLIRELRSHVSVTGPLAEMLDAALRKRNWLAHAYFRDRSREFMVEAGRNKMIIELKEAYELFKRADRSLDEIVAPLRDRIGLTPERLQTEFQRLMQELRGDR